MRRIRLLLIGCLWLLSFIVCAQEEETQNALSYKVEAFGSAASGDHTPFWLVSNRYGVVPLDAGNGYLKPGVFFHQSFGKGFRWGAGIDLVASAPRYRNIYIQQLYAELGYKSLLLSIGSKERTTSLWDLALSSGDMVLSPNARPIPEISLSMPNYTVVPLTKGWMQIKGGFAVGRSFDKAYLEHFANEKQVYNDNILWHHKSVFVRMKDTKNAFPLSVEVGVRHWAQWGGTSTDPEIGVQPHSLKDFARIVFGKAGGEGSSISDSINVLGNHYGSYDFRLGYSAKNWDAFVYHQNYFEDKSGMIFNNHPDGLWGLQVNLQSLPWLQKVVVEHMNTRYQTGPFHFILFDRDKYPKALGGGGDDYYNNGEYLTGTSYFTRGLGSPLLLSPEYNEDGDLTFRHNRIRAWHTGLQGKVSSTVDYRFLLSHTTSWGTSYKPVLNIKESASGLVEITYRHPHLEGWSFTGSVAVDTGDYVGKGIGFGLCVSRRGVLDF